jgi:hypothetical protein
MAVMFTSFEKDYRFRSILSRTVSITLKNQPIRRLLEADSSSSRVGWT